MSPILIRALIVAPHCGAVFVAAMVLMALLVGGVTPPLHWRRGGSNSRSTDSSHRMSLRLTVAAIVAAIVAPGPHRASSPSKT